MLFSVQWSRVFGLLGFNEREMIKTYSAFNVLCFNLCIEVEIVCTINQFQISHVLFPTELEMLNLLCWDIGP